MKKLEQLGISPVPWTKAGDIVDDNEGRVIFNAYEDDDYANARLIAAAPDLYEALLKALPWLADIGEEVVGTEPAACIAEIVKEAEAALAKASGEGEERK